MRGAVQVAALLGALTVGAAVARAAEHVTLSNGFGMDCDHHGLIDGQVRLYLDSAESSYIAFKPEEVSGVETVPDAPPGSARPTATAAGHGGNPRVFVHPGANRRWPRRDRNRA